ITAAASRLLKGESGSGQVSPEPGLYYPLDGLNNMVQSLVTTHPPLVLLWCQVLLIINYTNYSWWTEVHQTPSLSCTKLLSPHSSGEGEEEKLESRLAMVNREIVRRGALILFCDYVCLEGIHLSQSGSLLMLYVDKLLNTPFRVLARMVDTLACRRVEMLLAETLQNSIAQLPVEELERIQEYLQTSGLALRHQRFYSLLDRFRATIADSSSPKPPVTSHPLDGDPPIAPEKVVPEKEWYVALVKSQCCLRGDVSLLETTELLTKLPAADLLSVMSCKDFNLSLLCPSLSLGVRRLTRGQGSLLLETALQVTLEQLAEVTGSLPVPHQSFLPPPQPQPYWNQLGDVYDKCEWQACEIMAELVEGLQSILCLGHPRNAAFPIFLTPTLRNIIVSISRLPLVNSYTRVPPLVWKLGWSPQPGGEFGTTLPEIPVDFLQEKDEDLERTQLNVLAVQAITSLVLSAMTLPTAGNPAALVSKRDNISTHHPYHAWDPVPSLSAASAGNPTSGPGLSFGIKWQNTFRISFLPTGTLISHEKLLLQINTERELGNMDYKLGQFLLELYSQWLIPGSPSNRRTPTILISEVVRSQLQHSPLFDVLSLLLLSVLKLESWVNEACRINLIIHGWILVLCYYFLQDGGVEEMHRWFENDMDPHLVGVSLISLCFGK
ncbi:hypothetical protein GOODEAATRI_023128, partial [Goodea atripinnis]